MKTFFFALIVLLVAGCSKDYGNSEKQDYFVFGNFYGMCQGEQCVEIFKITNDQLFEDEKDEYPSRTEFYKGKFNPLSEAEYENVKDLESFLPQEIFNETENNFGCADCADQGGMYIEYKKGDVHKFWIIDNAKSAIPAYMHAFVDKVRASTEALK